MVQLRRFPYPYRAMLAICSDLDETPDRRTYWEIVRFLNSTEETRLGAGLGLEVGNSIYFDMPPEQFSYANTDEVGRQMARLLIRSGHIDCLHSFGDHARTREHARRALDELARHDCRLQVWVDHATAPSNFGADIMRGRGDVPGDPAYHADLTCEFGVRYVWRGRVTSVIGQDCARSLRGLFERRHPLASGRTIGKEMIKGVLGRLGNRKYAQHGSNQLLRRTQLRDGRPVYEFVRCNPFWGGVGQGTDADGLARVLTAAALGRLVERGGTCVLYAHLGKVRNPDLPFASPTCNALRRLADHCRSGRILVTTTRRLLGYSRAVREVSLQIRTDSGGNWIDVQTPQTSRGAVPFATGDLDGLTIYVPGSGFTRLSVDGLPVAAVQLNPADETGRASMTVPWRRLELPCV